MKGALSAMLAATFTYAEDADDFPAISTLQALSMRSASRAWLQEISAYVKPGYVIIGRHPN